jgi:nitroreductase
MTDMNETIKVINSRRSIRRYKAEQIKDTELQEILNSALYAPNAVNQQKWHFTVIQNKDMLSRMVGIIKENIINSQNEFLSKRASDPGYNTFYNAPTVIMISGDEKAMQIQIDCGLAAENIALAAESLNIGSCIITSSGFLFMSQKGMDLKKELGIPEGYNHICTIALGYKDSENPASPPRNRDVINYIK